MSIDYSKKIAVLNNKARRNDAFHVKFLGVPENESNFLGRYVRSISRPSLDFVGADHRYRGSQYKDRQNLTIQPVTAVFADDEEGLVNNVIYAMILRQLNKVKDNTKRSEFTEKEPRQYKFGIRVSLYNAAGEITEAYEYTNCFISSVMPATPMTADNMDAEITVTIEADDINLITASEYLTWAGSNL